MPSIVDRIRASYQSAATDEYVHRLCSSWLLPPWLLFGMRLTIGVYIFIVIFFQLGYLCTHRSCAQSERSFSYFTVLGYWGLGFYFAFASAHTASYARSGRPWLQSWPAWLRWLHSVLYATITVFPFLVTAVFWAALAGGAFYSQYSTWSNISQHALNSVFAFLEIVLPRTLPHPWINVAPLVVILACYLGLAYLTHATEGFYVYPFLDPSTGNGLVAGWVIGILVIAIVLFIVVRYAIWLRRWLAESKLDIRGKLATPRASPRAANKYRDEVAQDVEMNMHTVQEK